MTTYTHIQNAIETSHYAPAEKAFLFAVLELLNATQQCSRFQKDHDLDYGDKKQLSDEERERNTELVSALNLHVEKEKEALKKILQAAYTYCESKKIDILFQRAQRTIKLVSIGLGYLLIVGLWIGFGSGLHWLSILAPIFGVIGAMFLMVGPIVIGSLAQTAQNTVDTQWATVKKTADSASMKFIEEGPSVETLQNPLDEPTFS